ncbi:hypothetical protein FB451DRAFT_1402343 [Mycena latifolia]|nr:hypothetical protein FB451DRAFT_1402343 [Mycena latifolia]
MLSVCPHSGGESRWREALSGCRRARRFRGASGDPELTVITTSTPQQHCARRARPRSCARAPNHLSSPAPTRTCRDAEVGCYSQYGNSSTLQRRLRARARLGGSDLKIPARISQAQVGLRRDLSMGEFARNVEAQSTYKTLVSEVQGVLDMHAIYPSQLKEKEKESEVSSPTFFKHHRSGTSSYNPNAPSPQETQQQLASVLHHQLQRELGVAAEHQHSQARAGDHAAERRQGAAFPGPVTGAASTGAIPSPPREPAEQPRLARADGTISGGRESASNSSGEDDEEDWDRMEDSASDVEAVATLARRGGATIRGRGSRTSIQDPSGGAPARATRLSNVEEHVGSTAFKVESLAPVFAFAMMPENIRPLLENAREVHARLSDCIAEIRSLLAARP